ncbi:DUF1283 domain-containing protein [Pantoea endophytica]
MGTRSNPSQQKSENLNTKESTAVETSQELLRRCVSSKNLHAYWESTTKRCLDRTTGRDALL